jgi:hypothetical protein
MGALSDQDRDKRTQDFHADFPNRSPEYSRELGNQKHQGPYPVRSDPEHPRVEHPEEGRSLPLSDGTNGNDTESLRGARILKPHGILAGISNPEEYIFDPGVTTKRLPSFCQSP